MFRDACRRANISPNEVRYVEAHGTGTPVGDPIEARAIGAVFGEGRSDDTPCYIGSIKTNIGHLEAGSGIAGLIKGALCLHHDLLVPSLHFQNPNPAIPFDELAVRVAQNVEPLSRGKPPSSSESIPSESAVRTLMCFFRGPNPPTRGRFPITVTIYSACRERRRKLAAMRPSRGLASSAASQADRYRICVIRPVCTEHTIGAVSRSWDGPSKRWPISFSVSRAEVPRACTWETPTPTIKLLSSSSQGWDLSGGRWGVNYWRKNLSSGKSSSGAMLPCCF